MLVLVATQEQQGAADGDYFGTVEGELVTPVVAECSTPGSAVVPPGSPAWRVHGRQPRQWWST